MSKDNKIIVIVGTTASGKTGLAVDLAHKYNGEIISADSRQVYKYMDIGTGKDLDEYKIKLKVKDQRSRVVKIPYHLISVVHPNTEFNLAKWHKAANRAIKDIIKRGKLPIIAGGTGLYAQALVDGFDLSPVKPDKELRERLESRTAAQLLAQLKRLDKKFADGLHESDQKNKRRLIRYIEIKSSGVKEAELPIGSSASKTNYDFLIIGLTWPREIVRERIYKRLLERLNKEKMIEEVQNLRKNYGVSWKRLESFGLEYKYISLYLRGQIDYDKMVELLNIAIGQFAKRQMTWLKRWERQGGKIQWVRNIKEADKLVKKFVK
ncbi:MAG: tRNA (adenosine(37)-N6)-dimethylallyltransferase MiaA [Candidatus Falkowbacteria bacterium]